MNALMAETLNAPAEECEGPHPVCGADETVILEAGHP